MEQNMKTASIPQEESVGKLLDNISGVICDIASQSNLIRDKIVGPVVQNPVADWDNSSILGWLRSIRSELHEIRETISETYRNL